MTIEEKRKKNLSRLLQAFRRPSHCPHRGMKKCEGTSAFSEENPRDRRKSLLETEMARTQRNHGVKFCFHSGILSRRALENDDCRKGLPDSRQQEASGSSLFTARVISGTRLMTSVSGSLLRRGPDGARSAVDRKAMKNRNEFSRF